MLRLISLGRGRRIFPEDYISSEKKVEKKRGRTQHHNDSPTLGKLGKKKKGKRGGQASGGHGSESFIFLKRDVGGETGEDWATGPFSSLYPWRGRGKRRRRKEGRKDCRFADILDSDICRKRAFGRGEGKGITFSERLRVGDGVKRWEKKKRKKPSRICWKVEPPQRRGGFQQNWRKEAGVW